MRKLDRPNPPACLSKFRHGRNYWRDVSFDDKSEIWQQLEQMQGNFCAYCQRSIRQKSKDAHIEHFFRRNSAPQKTFVWDNLFGSCEDKNTCGNYKDNKATHIDLDRTCKPDIMDPDDFLQFLPSGSVHTKPDLAPYEQLVASNTIHIFNLNSSSLKNRRREAARVEGDLARFVLEYLAEYPDDPEILQELSDNRSRIAALEFSAARMTVWT